MSDIITLTMNPAIDVSTSIERVVPTRKLRCSAGRRDPGGGGINVARVIVRLGGKVIAVFPAGGLTGQLLCRLLARDGVPTLPIHVAEETREDFTVLEEDSGRQFRFVLPGPLLAETEWHRCLETLRSMGSRPRYVIASGSLPPGVPTDFYVRVAKVTRDIGAQLVLDTSGAPLREALDYGVYLIKPNLRELRELTGKPLSDQPDQIEACRELVESGSAQVVSLTLGHRGSLLVTRDKAWRSPGLKVDAVSAVGAGDSFLAGLTWALAAGHSMDNAFRYGIAAGSAALLAAGTELCHRDDVENMHHQVVSQVVWEREMAVA